MAVDTQRAAPHHRGVMMRRLGMLLLVVAVALGGLASTACAGASCAQMTRARMRCCPSEGIHQARSCCDGRVGTAAPADAGALERAPQAPVPAALPARLPAATAPLVHAAVPTIAAPGVGPPDSLLRQHTSLLL